MKKIITAINNPNLNEILIYDKKIKDRSQQFPKHQGPASGGLFVERRTDYTGAEWDKQALCRHTVGRGAYGRKGQVCQGGNQYKRDLQGSAEPSDSAFKGHCSHG